MSEFNSQEPSISQTTTAASGVRHAEKRRVSTCRFADRIAKCCIDHYRAHVPPCFREIQKQICLAAVVAFFQENENHVPNQVSSDECKELQCSGQLFVLGMGVGTKFLSQEVLKQELRTEQVDSIIPAYGRRVRDCHAEVLARRALQRQLLLEMRADHISEQAHTISVLHRMARPDGTVFYQLKAGVSLHLYCSSAPCGNATVSLRK